MPRIKKSVREIKNRIVSKQINHLRDTRNEELAKAGELGADTQTIADIKQAYAIIQNALERRRSD
tara:strand:+ start:183 stop:377 length:195 start_codon:yes stop_codon:yes gene_type:complete